MDDKKRIEHFMSEIARLSNQVVDLQNERDALDAQVEAIAKDRDDWKNAMARAASVLLLHKVPTKNINVDKALAEIKAEAGRAGFVAGAEMWCDCGVESQYKADCLIGIEADADRYTAKIRNTGTWLKDSNVNGGKRGGEK